MPVNFGRVDYLNSTASNALGLLGAVVPFQTAPSSPGANSTGATDAAHLLNPFPYAYLYDVVVSIDASAAGGGTVNIFDAITGGARIKSLTAGIVIPGGVTTPTNYSAMAQGVMNQYYNQLVADNVVEEAIVNQPYARGAIFSTRSVTGATGGLTNMTVTYLFMGSDKRFS
jgi:hypothetical protein